MKNNYEGTVIQVLKGVKNKQFVDWHLSVNLEKNFIAFGCPQKPSKENKSKMSCDGEFFFLVKCDETNTVTGYVGTLHSVIIKDTHPELYAQYAKQYGALYYDYQKYNTIYLVKQAVAVNEQTIEHLLNGRSYLTNKAKQFNLDTFFKNRTNQVYLRKA